MAKIIIAGGGTGGHIFPAVAIANALKQLDAATEVLFVGAKGKMEMEKVPQAGYRIEGLDIAGFNRTSLLSNIGLPFKLIKSFFQVRKIFESFKPDACIGVGGYSTFPVLKLAQQKGIPTFIHESNSFAGKSNILLGKKATKVFTGTSNMEQFFPAEKIQVTGNPVRASIAYNRPDKQTAIAAFGLDASKPTILAIGGSLGARSINAALAAGLDAINDAGVQLIWQTGKTTAAQFKEKAAGRSNVWCDAFINQMEQAYAAADVVISRAGAMSVAELCVVAKPAIFVPFPLAAEDHQTVNAMHLVNQGAALLVKDADAAKALVPTALDLVKDAGRRVVLQEKIAPLAISDADTVVAKTILQYLNK
jgi:UDP-N-acetylglucosamine--N-acetylmuramyl-(pentapeptide) pyrophosphoryl-undecaprenol N-acetylglucosamine transferase